MMGCSIVLGKLMVKVDGAFRGVGLWYKVGVEGARFRLMGTVVCGWTMMELVTLNPLQ